MLSSDKMTPIVTNLAKPSTEQHIRLATPADISVLGQTLGQAFAQDPFLNWLIQQPDKERRFSAIFELYLRSAIRQCQQTYTTENQTACSIWIPPGKKHFSAVSDIFLVLKLIPLIGVRRIASRLIGNSVMESHHPSEPHYYLLAVGVKPGNQGQGLGRSVIEPVLEKCDRERMPAYLETSNEQVIRLYEKFGFTRREEFKIPFDGPPIWTMWREPQ